MCPVPSSKFWTKCLLFIFRRAYLIVLLLLSYPNYICTCYITPTMFASSNISSFTQATFGDEGVDLLLQFLSLDSGKFSSGLGYHKLLLSAVNAIWCCVSFMNQVWEILFSFWNISTLLMSTSPKSSTLTRVNTGQGL